VDPDWVIAADDRTGALEVAGMCGGAVVTTSPGAPPTRRTVVDLGTRHVAAEEAARRAAVVDGLPAARAGHKIDSLLRGNWAAELLARDRRIVVVPAFPAMGRVCAGGVVRAHGTPVDELDDARRAATTSRPAEVLGADEVDARSVRAWLTGTGRIAVCDASTDADLAAIAATLGAHPEVLLAGTAAALAAALGSAPQHPPLPLPTPALVVCGSRHPVAAAQLAALVAVPGLTVLTPTAEELAAEARYLLDGMRTLVVIGGDTAAAVLGPGDVTVTGTVGPGMPWCRRILDRDLQLVTKAGAFGDPGSIVRLFVR
jgi:4-hydroxythreonine-4-phosphate dehydrogenase